MFDKVFRAATGGWGLLLLFVPHMLVVPCRESEKLHSDCWTSSRWLPGAMALAVLQLLLARNKKHVIRRAGLNLGDSRGDGRWITMNADNAATGTGKNVIRRAGLDLGISRGDGFNRITTNVVGKRKRTRQTFNDT